MTTENKSPTPEPKDVSAVGVLPESTEQTTEAREAAPPQAAPPTFDITVAPSYKLTAREIINRGNALAQEWNALAKEQSELDSRLWLIRQHYGRIHAEMRALVATCREHELPLSPEMTQMCDERLPDGTALPPKPADAENKEAK